MKHPNVIRTLFVPMAAALLAGCGLAGTGAAAGTTGVGAAQQASQAEGTIDQVQADLQAAQDAAAATRREAEAASE